MPRRRTFTASVVRRIPGLVDQGLSAAEIAESIGCTVGTLRVRCSQFGIRLRRKSLNESKSTPKEYIPSRSELSPGAQGKSELRLVITEDAAKRLRQQAKFKRMSYQSLAACLLEIIARDRLYDAVLDGYQDDQVQAVWAV
jgi:hypothetical protein